MLNWPKGSHPDDGPWAPHWYPAVWNSTGFSKAEGPLPTVVDQLQDILNVALPLYKRLEKVKLTV